MAVCKTPRSILCLDFFIITEDDFPMLGLNKISNLLNELESYSWYFTLSDNSQESLAEEINGIDSDLMRCSNI